MRRSALDTTSAGGDEALDGGRVVSTGKLFFLRLDALENGDSEDLRIDPLVQVEDL
jgi:hypothetical protein